MFKTISISLQSSISITRLDTKILGLTPLYHKNWSLYISMLHKNVVAPKKMGRYQKIWWPPQSLVTATRFLGRCYQDFWPSFSFKNVCLAKVNLKDDAIVYRRHLGLNELLTVKVLTSKAI